MSHAPGVRGFCQCIQLTFNLFRVLHDIFILHKVIDQRYHGEDQCDPHNDIGKDLQLREVGDHQADHDHLEGGLAAGHSLRNNKA